MTVAVTVGTSVAGAVAGPANPAITEGLTQSA